MHLLKRFLRSLPDKGRRAVSLRALHLTRLDIVALDAYILVLHGRLLDNCIVALVRLTAAALRRHDTSSVATHTPNHRATVVRCFACTLVLLRRIRASVHWKTCRLRSEMLLLDLIHRHRPLRIGVAIFHHWSAKTGRNLVKLLVPWRLLRYRLVF